MSCYPDRAATVARFAELDVSLPIDQEVDG